MSVISGGNVIPGAIERKNVSQTVNAAAAAALGNKLPIDPTAPTITLSAANAASTITNAVTVSAADGSGNINPKFRYVGGVVVAASLTFPYYTSVRGSNVRVNNSFGNVVARICVNCTKCELPFIAQGGNLRVLVDGKEVINSTVSGGTFTMPGATGDFYNVIMDWGAVRATRVIEVQCSYMYFGGIRVGPLDTVYPAANNTGLRDLIVSDSYGLGTGADQFTLGLGNLNSAYQGLEAWNLSVGGTGYLAGSAQGGSDLKFGDRAIPPLNSWRIADAAGTGSVSFSQGSTTASITCATATPTNVQALFDATFGAGVYTVCGQQYELFIFGRGSKAFLDAPITLTLTGGANMIASRYLGDVFPCLPKDGADVLQPGYITYMGSRNDGNLSPSQVAAEFARVITESQNRYPTLVHRVVGPMYNPGNPPANLIAVNAAMKAVAATALKKINGYTPYVDMISPPFIFGTGRVGAEAGDGNSDLFTYTDNSHPSKKGHPEIAGFITQVMRSWN